ncbi:MAG: efflux RND transporter permease subunit [Melioribacteraceae bacterium]
MTITELSIKRPTIVVVIFSVLAFLGIFSYLSLNYELTPKMSMPVISIITVYPGASPSEVENSVTKKIEDVVSSLENLNSIKSSSYANLSYIIVEFKASADINIALQEAQRKINSIIYQLPESCKAPTFVKFSVDEMPVLRIGITAQTESTQLFDIVKTKIQPSLSAVEGVAQVNIIGGEEREIKINVKTEKLEAYNLSILQINQAIQSSNLDFPTGKIKNENQQILIRLAGKFSSIPELENLIITRDLITGSPIKLKDIAEIQDSKKETELINRINGNNSIGLLIQKQADANAVKVSELVRKKLAQLEDTYKNNELKFIIAQDSSEFTLEAANAVMKDLGLAVLLVALVMLIFLHSLKNSFIVMLSIPASIVSTFIAMYILGLTLNLLTLLALSLTIGILVDDSIVVLENIYRHIKMGKPGRVAAVDGRQEIAFTALSITLVDVVVFLPIALVSGMVGDILRPFSTVIIVSTLMSLFVSFTVTPLLASRLLKEENSGSTLMGRINLWIEAQIEKLSLYYTRILKWSLGHKRITLAIALFLLLSSFSLIGFGFIGSEFANMGDRGEFVIQVELPKDATIEQTNDVVQKIEKMLFNKPEIVTVASTIGSSGNIYGSFSSPNKADINVKLLPSEKRKIPSNIYANQIKNEIESIMPGINVSASAMGIFGTSEGAPVQIVISGTELDSLMSYAAKVLEQVKKIKGTTEAKLTVETGNPEITILIDREKMSSLGLSLQMVGANLQTAFSGNTDNKFRDKEYEYDINIKLDDFDKRSITDVSNITFTNNSGQIVKLHQFAGIFENTGPAKLERKNRVTAVTLVSNVIGRPEGTVGAEIREAVEQIQKPGEASIAFEGSMKEQEEGFASLGFAFLASIFFVYLLMVALYNSYVYPFVILFSIPVAIVGALLALALSMQALSIFSIMGMIILIGLVGKNAILLVDFTNQLKEKGYRTTRALMMAGKIRLRPILMTTLSIVIGMFPIALATGAGAEWKNGLAWVLIGGLTSSMLLTLVVVPVVYLIFDIFISKFKKKKTNPVVFNA